MKEKKLDKLEAEEYLADSFSDYFRTWRMKWEKVVGNVWKPLWKKLYDAVKGFFKQVKDWITGVSKNKNQIKKLFDDILDGEIDKEMLGEILGNKKRNSTTRPNEGETTQSSNKRIIHITDDNARYFKKNLNDLVKSDSTPENFFQWLKDAFGSEKKSAYIDREIDGEVYNLRIADHTATARNFAFSKEYTNNTSLVIKIGEKRFKGDKRVDLVEYVYNKEDLTLEKKRGIIKGLNDWMHSWEYTDKNYDLTHKSIRATLEGWEVKYQLTYHGSPYEFEKKDISNKQTPKTVSVWVKSKFSDKWAYKEVPVIREVKDITLYQWGKWEWRQFWTENKKYAEQFGEIQEKRGHFYEVDNGNRMTKVYVEVGKSSTKISKLIWNSLENNYNWVKPNRLNGERLSIKEAETLLTKSWKNLKERILIGIDKDWNLVLEDGRHLLEAYRILWKEIPSEKLWFNGDKAKKLFEQLYSE